MYRGINYSVRQTDNGFEFIIPPSPFNKREFRVNGFGSMEAAENAAIKLIDDWYISR